MSKSTIVVYKKGKEVATVQDIVHNIAVEPQISVVTCLILFLNNVNICERQNNEDSPAFVSRFCGVAADHLMHEGVASNFKFVEIIAIMLLNDSNLSEEDLSNANIQLVAMAEEGNSTAFQECAS